ncbi:hypothetical protein GCM10025867_46050 (plasmid) [Frondihabitans sucicola]|uniref:Uncharacterized protein n=1 Tax=Frondihabitans sucicola TaxID=1268041 RepID=A0ABN6Y4Y0_9MICO|nr:hypothetical protein [Frondihabitans sucicola]BDZ52364.1 hypothetical protein GCM10025867_46050 [Frondihabitans sucicola]
MIPLVGGVPLDPVGMDVSGLGEVGDEVDLVPADFTASGDLIGDPVGNVDVRRDRPERRVRIGDEVDGGALWRGGEGFDDGLEFGAEVVALLPWHGAVPVLAGVVYPPPSTSQAAEAAVGPYGDEGGSLDGCCAGR